MVIGLAALVLPLSVAVPAHACGYWSCTEYDFGTYCTWIDG